jgi:hypothetical protein
LKTCPRHIDEKATTRVEALLFLGLGRALAHRPLNVVLQRSILEYRLFQVCIYHITD